MLTYVFKTCEPFETTQELLSGTSALLVSTVYWMVAFNILVFDASLFEETPNRKNSEI